MTYDGDTDRWWWTPIVIFAAWLFAIAFAVVEWGAWAGVFAWLGVPIAIGLGLAIVDARDKRRRASSRRRHPAGSNLGGKRV